MGNRAMLYWIVVVAALAAVAESFILRRLGDPHSRQLATYLGWGAIALLLIARFGLRPRKPPEPPMPRD